MRDIKYDYCFAAVHRHLIHTVLPEGIAFPPGRMSLLFSHPPDYAGKPRRGQEVKFQVGTPAVLVESWGILPGRNKRKVRCVKNITTYYHFHLNKNGQITREKMIWGHRLNISPMFMCPMSATVWSLLDSSKTLTSDQVYAVVHGKRNRRCSTNVECVSNGWRYQPRLIKRKRKWIRNARFNKV